MNRYDLVDRFEQEYDRLSPVNQGGRLASIRMTRDHAASGSCRC